MLLALKLLLVPLLIAAITVAGQRLGPRIAGALTGLPVVAGPIVFFIALEQGASFAASSAGATLAGEASLGAFCILYASTCLRWPWWASLTIGWTGFAASTLALDLADPSLPIAALLALSTPIAIRALTPQPELPPRLDIRRSDQIGLRMGAGVALVVCLTALADGLGARLSGLLTIFPVATTILAVFSHRNQGAPFAVHLLRGLGLGLYSLTAFFATLTLTLEGLGTAFSFLGAVALALLAQGIVLHLMQRSILPSSSVERNRHP